MGDKWEYLAQAFANLGEDLRLACENMKVSDEAYPDRNFDQLYTNYAQLLESIKVQRTVINNRFDAIDLMEL
jgi:hypothetical protein